MSGKPGRPPEDRLKRQHEIFLAVAPLIDRYGAKRLTMRQAARAAHLSLGGLYHYFPTKGDVLFGDFGILLQGIEDWFTAAPEDAPLFEVIAEATMRRLRPGAGSARWRGRRPR